MQNCVIFKDSWKGLTSTGFDDFKITSLSCIRMSRTPREKWIHKVANKRSARMNYLKLNKLIRMVMVFALKYCWFFNGLFSRFKEMIFLYSLVIHDLLKLGKMYLCETIPFFPYLIPSDLETPSEVLIIMALIIVSINSASVRSP